MKEWSSWQACGLWDRKGKSKVSQRWQEDYGIFMKPCQYCGKGSLCFSLEHQVQQVQLVIFQPRDKNSESIRYQQRNHKLVSFFTRSQDGDFQTQFKGHLHKISFIQVRAK